MFKENNRQNISMGCIECRPLVVNQARNGSGYYVVSGSGKDQESEYGSTKELGGSLPCLTINVLYQWEKIMAIFD